MAVSVLLSLTTKPDQGDVMVQFLRDILGDSRAYDGCISLLVVRDQDDPDSIKVLERWESRKHHEEYFAWRTESGTLAKSMDYLAAAPDLRYYDETDA